MSARPTRRPPSGRTTSRSAVSATRTLAPAVARFQGMGLARRSPRPHAAVLWFDFMLSDAQEMLAIGFLTQLVSSDSLSARADALCATLAGMAPLAVLGMKKNLNRIARGVLDEADLQRDIERSANSRDLQEGRAAWAEKRAPRFEGR